MPRTRILIFAGACLAAALALGVVALIAINGRSLPEATSEGRAAVGGDFTLVNQAGETVDQSLLQGRWSLVFFGFTYCPDYCPTTLQMLAATREALGEQANDLQIVFISVDPARDTPQALADYLSSEGFPPGVIGLTGSDDQVRQAAGAYRAFYERVGEGEAYTMNHSLTIYLMGPDGAFREALGHQMAPDEAARVIAEAMARG